MQKQIFRKEAMEQMSSPDQLDELMAVTSPRGWIALAGIGAILLLTVVWGFFGSIETSTKSNGVLIRGGGLQTMTAPQPGDVTAVMKRVGDFVKAGDVLMQLSSIESGSEEGQEPSSQSIVCTYPGRVLHISVVTGETVSKDAILAAIEFPEWPMQAVMYVSTKEGYQVEPGQTVQIMPAIGELGGSRTFIGSVQSAGRFPETRDSIFRTLQNPDWVNEFLPQGPLLEVVAQLPQNEDTKALYSGTPCTAKITVSRMRPIEFIFPVFRSQ